MNSDCITCGIDWAERHHDVAMVDGQGRVLATRRIEVGVAGVTELVELLAEHAEDPTDVAVAIETDKNLLVVALRAMDVTVYAINPRAVARYRERYGQAGGKSDPGDAILLANILRTDRHVHRPMPDISDQGLAVRALARQHQEAIWSRQQTVNRLRSVLLEFYPAALEAFPKLTNKAALAVLDAAPTPTKGAALTRRRIVSLLRRCGRAARSVVTPVAITFQTSRSTSRRCDGAPGDFIGDRPVNSIIHPGGRPTTISFDVVLQPTD